MTAPVRRVAAALPPHLVEAVAPRARDPRRSELQSSIAAPVRRVAAALPPHLVEAVAPRARDPRRSELQSWRPVERPMASAERIGGRPQLRKNARQVPRPPLRPSRLGHTMQSRLVHRERPARPPM